MLASGLGAAMSLIDEGNILAK
uniref:Uncharacterized protein n=1 Tax=Anguilla anguilla TaxID=7936 RepID=A0A0E9SLY1_ANGAN